MTDTLPPFETMTEAEQRRHLVTHHGGDVEGAMEVLAVDLALAHDICPPETCSHQFPSVPHEHARPKTVRERVEDVLTVEARTVHVGGVRALPEVVIQGLALRQAAALAEAGLLREDEG